jgi:hypothetical protein
LKKEREKEEEKKAPRTGPKETTERAGKTSCKHFKLCTTVLKRQQNNLKESCTQKKACGGVHCRWKWSGW